MLRANCYVRLNGNRFCYVTESDVVKDIIIFFIWGCSVNATYTAVVGEHVGILDIAVSIVCSHKTSESNSLVIVIVPTDCGGVRVSINCTYLFKTADNDLGDDGSESLGTSLGNCFDSEGKVLGEDVVVGKNIHICVEHKRLECRNCVFIEVSIVKSVVELLVVSVMIESSSWIEMYIQKAMTLRVINFKPPDGAVDRVGVFKNKECSHLVVGQQSHISLVLQHLNNEI